MSTIVKVDLIDTLMAWADEFHVESGDRSSVFYFSVPDDWAGAGDEALQTNVYNTMQDIYKGLYDRFRRAEPNDLSYLRAKSTHATILTPSELAAKPWLTARVPAAWEWTPCVVVAADGSFTRVDPEDFA